MRRIFKTLVPTFFNFYMYPAVITVTITFIVPYYNIAIIKHIGNIQKSSSPESLAQFKTNFEKNIF